MKEVIKNQILTHDYKLINTKVAACVFTRYRNDYMIIADAKQAKSNKVKVLT
ncbi:hypothetical protein JCM21531_376 [Acetivibrio straminisolvens JCM 21531]|jgi:hypothetical protein|uniref:Uncharacterized protein n=1 Tax=Acetivibrio straminisolvens JCM 21531 TaxID=1294263 RepID=W4V0M6_9FIRM|nr:hypothetical protein JCM21531_376 [Acetivibrio straminisolvens JCM 21531]